MQRTELLTYLDTLLTPHRFSDYAPNGLQIEGTKTIESVITAVTANQASIEKAMALKADLLLVHHGFFWKGESPCITGMKQRRIKSLLAHGINLCAYHLPLDAHETFGNNVQLAHQLGWSVEAIFEWQGAPIVYQTHLQTPVSLDALSETMAAVLGRDPLCVAGHERPIQTIAWCTGAAQDGIALAAEKGADLYVSGEISERTVDMARELNIHYMAAGHYATERYGVQALGAHLAEQFGLEHQFVDVPNPV